MSIRLNATNFYTENLFGIRVAQGLTEPDRNVPYVLQGGLGMPDRAYYLTDSAKMADLRSEYQQHIAAMLALAGYTDTRRRRRAGVGAGNGDRQGRTASREDSADVLKSNNKLEP